MAKNASKSNKEAAEPKKREILYQVATKRTAGIIKAYITFTYRIFHPGVTPRLILYGLLLIAPGIFFFKDLYWKTFFIVIGLALILLAFFRQYISLSMTKKNDPDYKSGAEFSYDFNDVSAAFRKNGEIFSTITKYKDISALYFDDEYFYLAIGKEVHVLPKNAFTIGDADGFEEFIYKKSKKVAKWLPNKMSDRIKKRRADRAVVRDEMKKK